MSVVIHAPKPDDPNKAKCGAWGRWLYIDSEYTRSKGYEINCKKCLGTSRQTTVSQKIEEDMIGKIFHCSWGYDMTLNDYAKVIAQTDKSILLQECYTNVSNDDGRGNGKAVPGGLNPEGEKFRLFFKVRDTGYGNPYPYWAGGPSYRSWHEWEGRPNYHNTWD